MNGLDPILHQPTRLTVLAFLGGCQEAEFSVVRDYCQVSDSVLSKTAAALETAGYLRVRKGYVGKRPRTWLSATRQGRTLLTAHLAALQQLAAAAEAAGAAAGAAFEPAAERSAELGAGSGAASRSGAGRDEG